MDLGQLKVKPSLAQAIHHFQAKNGLGQFSALQELIAHGLESQGYQRIRLKVAERETLDEIQWRISRQLITPTELPEIESWQTPEGELLYVKLERWQVALDAEGRPLQATAKGSQT